ncbi:chromosome partitioning atpase [Lactobacillus pasteurii DSM 23907 = CRBIP 24.76]|uniref:Chromosome partitioning ATPase n=1 Tax=Lactobacillus pasteurii DSM 23907 = CRBIP 24.76 TaxID=1423790 RepID=I7LAJ6_9LACO|nr:ParA family protein [Lactobacillus pasteurii]KRK07417.1 chromosome partitioning atpase [Lactobacillus pasteurii DSM 23907 = CRBIP 24.76]TDG77642.1 hypothetical protein C5L33_000053 [Lactobacillus pasteurii]CCI84756.1 Chromosome partitioning ATPase [Lactobacillus pasteurii DSM 23907 = CRBIP 24.76]
MEIITFSTVKGGIGKTTLSYNYAEYLAHQGHKVLLLDFDEQSSLSRIYDVTDQEGTAADILDVDNSDGSTVKIHHVKDNIDLIGGSTRLDTVQSRINDNPQKNMLLFLWLNKHYDRYNLDQYDYMIIDTHPDVQTATKNAIIVSDAVLSPVIPNQMSYDSIVEFSTRVEKLKNEAIDYTTGETFVKAKFFYLANEIRRNYGLSQDFLKMVEKEREEGVNWLAIIPEREIFNRSTSYKVSVAEMQEYAKINNADLPEEKRSNPEFMKMKRYFDQQKPQFYEEINEVFAEITKAV